jgi:hypothetical protein
MIHLDSSCLLSAPVFLDLVVDVTLLQEFALATARAVIVYDTNLFGLGKSGKATRASIYGCYGRPATSCSTRFRAHSLSATAMLNCRPTEFVLPV